MGKNKDFGLLRAHEVKIFKLYLTIFTFFIFSFSLLGSFFIMVDRVLNTGFLLVILFYTSIILYYWLTSYF